MLWPSFVGPAYRARSQAIAADELINLYTEVTENAVDVKQTTFYGTPGLKPLLTVGTLGCRGSWSQDGRTFTVVGALLYELNTTVSPVTATARGTVRNDGLPVSFASNGRGGEQLAIVSGGQLSILSLTTGLFTSPVALPLTNAAVMIDFIDGYFVLLEANTIRVWFCALENGLLWDALDFFAVSVFSANLVGIKVWRDRIWAFGSQSTVIYYDSGNADNPFVPYPGSVMEEGLVTPWGVIVMGETIFWLAQDNQGRNRFVSAVDYSPVVISTPPISFALASYPTIADAEVLGYEQEGHPFIAWTFPTGETLVYDAREKDWHKRDTWDDASGTGQRWRARGLCATDTRLIVGDFQTGALYTLDLDTFQDRGQTIRRLRRAPYPSAENQWLFLDRIELGMQAGIGVTTGQGSQPKAMLAISKDGGFTYAPPTTTSIGLIGETTNRAIWRRLGRVRADRLVIEITQTDPVRCVWGPGLWLTARPGSGAL